jgi:3-oxoacyl-[acyl-carrier-protein] synthase II
MDKKRIVITGIGVVSPIGIGKETFWQSLREGKSAAKPITLFDTSDFKVKVAGEISGFDAKEILGKKGLVDFDRSTTLLLTAGKFALEDAALEINESNTNSTGISIGTTFGSLQSLSDFDRESLVDGPMFVNPSRFPNTVMNSQAGRLAIRYGIKGHNCTVSTGMTASSDALDYAIDSINFNRTERMLSGGVEELGIQVFIGFYNLGYLSGMDGSHAISCPFDKRRNGVIFSEGATIVIIEELNSALSRKANIYGEILSISSNYDPYRFYKYDPAAKGMISAMTSAISDANLKPADIDCIFANANSTKEADLIETNAIKKVFGDVSKKVPVTSIKSMIGESLSPSGITALAAAIGAIKNDFIPPTINYSEKDPECDLNYVLNKAKPQKIDKVMINSFSPNGSNTVTVIGKYKN